MYKLARISSITIRGETFPVGDAVPVPSTKPDYHRYGYTAEAPDKERNCSKCASCNGRGWFRSCTVQPRACGSFNNVTMGSTCEKFQRGAYR